MPVALSLMRTSLGPVWNSQRPSFTCMNYRVPTYLGNWHVLDFYVEIRALIDYDTTLAGLWNFEGLNFFVSHGDVA